MNLNRRKFEEVPDGLEDGVVSVELFVTKAKNGDTTDRSHLGKLVKVSVQSLVLRSFRL